MELAGAKIGELEDWISTLDVLEQKDVLRLDVMVVPIHKVVVLLCDGEGGIADRRGKHRRLLSHVVDAAETADKTMELAQQPSEVNSAHPWRVMVIHVGSQIASCSRVENIMVGFLRPTRYVGDEVWVRLAKQSLQHGKLSLERYHETVLRGELFQCKCLVGVLPRFSAHSTLETEQPLTPVR